MVVTMKYIPGSAFINNTTKFGKFFKRGQVYTLNHIKKVEDGIKYIFLTDGGEKEITFKDSKEADTFLSNF